MRAFGLFFVAVACSLAACAHSPSNPLASELADAPDWVKGDCRVKLKNASKASACGVGSISGTENPSLARSGAQARARTDLARSLQTHVKAMVKDYQATASAAVESAKGSTDEQYVADVARQITDTVLSGSRLDNSWISPAGTYYALVVLDAESFAQALGQMKGLDDAL